MSPPRHLTTSPDDSLSAADNALPREATKFGLPNTLLRLLHSVAETTLATTTTGGVTDTVDVDAAGGRFPVVAPPPPPLPPTLPADVNRNLEAKAKAEAETVERARAWSQRECQGGNQYNQTTLP